MKLPLQQISHSCASFFAFSLLVLFTGCTKNISRQDEPSGPSSAALTDILLNHPEKYVAGEVVVKFKAGTAYEIKSRALLQVEATVTERILTKAMEDAGDREGLYLLHTSMSVLTAIRTLNAVSQVQYAEPNFLYQHAFTTNDTYFANNSLWGMYSATSEQKNAFGCQAVTAWAAGHTGSSDVHVGVIDEGIQFDHPDLKGEIWTNPFDKADGIDNDGNGYVDDIHGWDFNGNNNVIYDGGNRGRYDDHGTHVSGTIGGNGNNNIGVAGVNWHVTIISAKFLGSRGGTSANAVKAQDYLTKLKTLHGIKLVASNNSWGGGGYSQALYDAISRANTNNILFVAAAGNGGNDGVGDNNDAVASYPSNYTLPNVIAVAAITSSGNLSSFSNYGETTVDIGAPGSGIWSTTAFNSYESYSGTSMATPHVTGAVALYASTHSGETAAQIKSAILSSAVSTPSLAGKTVTGGRLNVSGF